MEFIGSRDGIQWHRYDRTRYAASGTEDEQMAFMGTGLIFRNNEIWQYGTTFRTNHGDTEGRKKQIDGKIVRYTQRIDGFASLTAGNEEGIARTVPIKVTGRQLRASG